MNSNQNYHHKSIDYLEMGLYDDDFSNNNLASIQKNIRLNFIRKVLGILGAQLLLTVMFCILSMTSKAFLEFQMRNIAIFFICAIGSIVIMITLSCFSNTAKKVPTNYILLSLFTFFESYMVSFICGLSNPRTVMMAAVMTFSMVVSLVLYAFYTKTDFSMQGGALFIFGCAFMMFSIFGLFTNNKIFHIILCVVGIILFGFYLVYDIQLIVGNKTLSLDTDDYIIGALMLYTDIVSLFIQILQLLQLLGDSSH